MAFQLGLMAGDLREVVGVGGGGWMRMAGSLGGAGGGGGGAADHGEMGSGMVRIERMSCSCWCCLSCSKDVLDHTIEEVFIYMLYRNALTDQKS